MMEGLGQGPVCDKHDSFKTQVSAKFFPRVTLET